MSPLPLPQASPEEGADAAFFEYVAQSYRYFMAGDDEKCEAVDASKAAEFDERAGEITSATQRLLAVRSLRGALGQVGPAVGNSDGGDI